MKLIEFVPQDPEVLLSLEPEELAPGLLRYFAALEDSGQHIGNWYNLSIPSGLQDFHREFGTRVGRALVEGWMVLSHGGFIAPNPRMLRS